MKTSTNKKLPKPSWVTKSPNLELSTLDLERKTKPKIIAAIPPYNEQKTIAKVVLRAKKKVDRVIVIDGGSTDATSDIAEALGALVFKHEKNLGYGSAIKTCFEAAKKLNTDIMVILDGDGQHNPNEIPPLVSILRHIEFSRLMHFFGLIGILFLGGRTVMETWVLRNFNASGSLPLGPTLIMFLLVLLGVFTIYIGIILHAMARLWSREEK